MDVVLFEDAIRFSYMRPWGTPSSRYGDLDGRRKRGRVALDALSDDVS
jgi:hypothetical protein